MTISIDYGVTNIITVEQADLTFVSGTTYSHNIDVFRLALKDLEDDEIGMPFPTTHNHNGEIVLSGVTYSRFVEILTPYSIQYENTGSAYTVSLSGANNNVADVFIPTPLVTLVSNNAAGLQTVFLGGSGLLPSEQERLERIEKFLRNRQFTNPTTGKLEQYDDADAAIEFQADIFSDDGSTPYDGTTGIERRDRFETP